MAIRTFWNITVKERDEFIALHGTVTFINFSKDISQISNLYLLPSEIRSEINNFPDLKLRSSGFQEILGHVDRQLVLSIGGYWIDDNFYLESYGSNTFQWSESKGLLLTQKAS